MSRTHVVSRQVSAEFLLSAFSADQFPRPEWPEFAFLGRSNVGKSSLLNALVGQRVAFVSATPGRTQSINFFRVDRQFLFVDLPGYGYAKVPKAISAAWRALVESYLVSRSALTRAFILVDARRGWMEKDLLLKQWLEHYDRPFAVVATKADKLNQRERNVSQKAFREHYSGEILWFSAVTGQGVKEIWQTIWTTKTS